MLRSQASKVVTLLFSGRQRFLQSCLSTHTSPQLRGALEEEQQEQPSKSNNNYPKPEIDPFSLVNEELNTVSERVRLCISTDIPKLSTAANYFFKHGREGKRLRPTVLLLMASALASSSPSPDLCTVVDTSPASVHPNHVRRRQQRIAEITELIHVASLLHDDVLDEASTRRGLTALNQTDAGNKLAILAGDFLLARASVSLASLRTPEVIALMCQCLEHLVMGEVLQMGASPQEAASMEHYLLKTTYKTATLFANGCRSVAVLGDHSQQEVEAAWAYGRHLGLAFQLVDDILDFTGSSAELGKPALNDLRSGLSTAPVLFAAEQRPELLPMMKRRFRGEGDVEAAKEAVESSDGIHRARELAMTHAKGALSALESLPPEKCSHAEEARAALVQLTEQSLNRRK
jgi:geranyl diphosphate synthase